MLIRARFSFNDYILKGVIKINTKLILSVFYVFNIDNYVLVKFLFLSFPRLSLGLAKFAFS